MLIFCLLMSCALAPSQTAPIKNQQQQPTVDYLQRKTERLLGAVHHYEMVVPTSVDHRGDFVSYHLQQPREIMIGERRKRHAIYPRSKNQGQTTNHLPHSPLTGEFSHSNDHIYYKLSAYGQEFHFNLTLNTLLVSDNFVIESWGKSSVERHQQTSQACHYVGQSLSPTASRAAISNCNGLHGVFTTEDADYFVEPLWNHTNKIEVDGHPHIVYKRSSLKLQDGASHCGVTDKDQQVRDSHPDGWSLNKLSWALNNFFKWNSISVNNDDNPLDNTLHSENADWNKITNGGASGRSGRHTRSVSREKHVETLVVVDKMMVRYHGQQEIEPYVLTIMNIVAKLYHDPSIGNAVNVIVTRLVLLTEDQPNLFIGHHADRSLDSFCRWQRSINPPSDDSRGIAHHDNAILITRYDICTYKNQPCGTLGLAPVAGMCEMDRSCSINEDIGLASAFTIAHEIGHNFGMQHDGAGNPCGTPGHEAARIMAAQLTRDTSPFLWSNCSREYITNFFDSGQGSCLENVPRQLDIEFPSDLPGQRHDATEQCKLQYGSRSEACKPTEVCRELWCMNSSDRCVTNNIPAAEGTDCSSKRIKKGWCYRGKCMKFGYRPTDVDGDWGQWSTWGECSRSCGGGVKSSQRECDTPRPQHGGKYCIGERRRYKSCNIEDCPVNSTDFRIVQCHHHNSIPFRGKYYQWQPFSGASVKPCALNCMADGYNFYTERAPKVIDGTRCHPDSLDMCINGECRHVGCDKRLGSSAIEDKCRICDGSGDTCETISGSFADHLQKGAYHKVVVIPRGAIQIRIQETLESKNYLDFVKPTRNTSVNHNLLRRRLLYTATIALKIRPLHAPATMASSRTTAAGSIVVGTIGAVVVGNNFLESKGEDYYINGDWTIDWPRKFSVAGTIFHYEREAGSIELMHALGPISEDVVVMVLLQEDNLGINYQYNIPILSNDSQQDFSDFIWELSPWTACSVSCAKGTSESKSQCVRKDDHTPVEMRYCPPHLRPEDLRKECKQEPCVPEWTLGQWSECSHTCGGGVSSRPVMCTQMIDDTEQDVIEDSRCQGQKPLSQRRCNDEGCPPTWFTDEWSKCTPQCGTGKKNRNVYCMSSDGRTYMEDIHCDAARKPPARVTCNNGECPPPTWVSGEWGQCSGQCGKGQQRRSVQCRTYTGEASQTCHPYAIPSSTRQCDAPCETRNGPKGECVDTYSVAYCPLVLRFKFCNRDYFRNICCKTCTAANNIG